MTKIPRFKPSRGTADKVFNGNARVEAMYKTREWQRFRARYLMVNQKCYACGSKSTVVDHLVVHRGDITLFEKPDNMIPLCEYCHNTVTGLFDRHPVQKYQEKLVWLARARARNELSFRVKVIPYKS
jgi:5-methylcytosine-specific restriction endonuclease McrA